MLTKIISGGQIGADQGALEAAKLMGFPTGGMMPKGWITQDGSRPDFEQLYNMVEALVKGYPYRTYHNVKSSDGTIRFAVDFTTAGEVCTLKAILQYDKPKLNISVRRDEILEPTDSSVKHVLNWIKENNISILNIAGNSNKSYDLMQIKVKNFILALIKEMRK